MAAAEPTPQAQPRVSVVIAAYNHADYLGPAIESVLAQDYPDVELIVVNDGSTDRTPEVLQAYRDRVRVIDQANGGQSRALNHGWGLATGSLLSYLGADDLLEPDAVSAAVRCLSERPQAVLAYGDYLLVDPDTRPVREVSTGEFDRRRMVSELVCYPGAGVFFRAEAYRQAGPWDAEFRQMPDLEFWMRLARVGTFVRIPRRLALYRVHEGSQSFAMADAWRASEPLRMMQKYFADETDAEVLRWRPAAMAHAGLMSARLHIRSGRYLTGLRLAAGAVAVHPRMLVSPWALRLVAGAFVNRGYQKLIWWRNRLRS